jgi:serine/threonine protein kinase
MWRGFHSVFRRGTSQAVEPTTSRRQNRSSHGARALSGNSKLRQAAQAVLPGRVIGCRYRLVENLGAGGFGRVWKARDETLHVDVAVKEVRLPPSASAAEQAERLARAGREARNPAKLRNHPNIVAVHDVVIDDDIPWIVMRLVEGCSLEEHVAAHGPLSVDKVADVAVGVLRALGAAHEAGVAHRDVKPANVMLTANGEVLLTDFGIAVHQADTALTVIGMFIGSVEYTAPERLRGDDRQATSDLFSLGATLYQAAEGLSPFHRETPAASLTAVLFDQAPPPQRAGELATLITRLLDKDPDKRPTVHQALALAGTPPRPTIQSAPDGQPVQAQKTRVATTPGSTKPHQESIGDKLRSFIAGSLLIFIAGYGVVQISVGLINGTDRTATHLIVAVGALMFAVMLWGGLVTILGIWMPKHAAEQASKIISGIVFLVILWLWWPLSV